MTKHLDVIDQFSEPICVLICQHRACRKQDAAKVLAAFQAHKIVGIKYQGSGCLGQCGNGPNILVLPAQRWYHGVQSTEVLTILNLITA